MLSITVMQESIGFLHAFSRYSREIGLTVALLASNECSDSDFYDTHFALVITIIELGLVTERLQSNVY